MYGYRSPAIPYVLTDTFGNVTYAPVIPSQQPYARVLPSPMAHPYPRFRSSFIIYSSFSGLAQPNLYANPMPAYNYLDSNMCATVDPSTQGLTNNLFVFHLPASVTNQVLYQLF